MTKAEEASYFIPLCVRIVMASISVLCVLQCVCVRSQGILLERLFPRPMNEHASLAIAYDDGKGGRCQRPEEGDEEGVHVVRRREGMRKWLLRDFCHSLKIREREPLISHLGFLVAPAKMHFLLGMDGGLFAALRGGRERGPPSEKLTWHKWVKCVCTCTARRSRLSRQAKKDRCLLSAPRTRRRRRLLNYPQPENCCANEEEEEESRDPSV